MHSEPGKSRGSQTQLLDGFSQVTFMLDLKGGDLGVLVEFWTKKDQKEAECSRVLEPESSVQ